MFKTEFKITQSVKRLTVGGFQTETELSHVTAKDLFRTFARANPQLLNGTYVSKNYFDSHVLVSTHQIWVLDRISTTVGGFKTLRAAFHRSAIVRPSLRLFVVLTIFETKHLASLCCSPERKPDRPLLTLS